MYFCAELSFVGPHSCVAVSNQGPFLAIYVYTPSIGSIYLCVLVVIFPVKDLSETTLLMILKFRTKLCCVLEYQPHIAYQFLYVAMFL